MFHLLKLVDKFMSIINSPHSAMDAQSYLSAIAFPPVFYPFFSSSWPTGAGCSLMPAWGIFPSSGCWYKHFCAHSPILGFIKAEEWRGAEHLSDSVKTAFLSLSLTKMSLRVPSHTQVCFSCLQKRKIL